MTLHSPLLPTHIDRGASMLPYADPASSAEAAEVVETFGALELEYAALRKGCALFDLPQRGTIVVRGADRLEFLNRMVTQELKDLDPWRWRHSFWLNRKGRIDADLRITRLEDQIRFDVDVHAVARTIATLQSYIFAEDIVFEDTSERRHRLALHGPTSILLVSSIGEPVGGPAPAELRHGGSCAVRIAGREVHVDRDDACAEIGLELTCASADAEDVYAVLLGAGAAPEGEEATGLAPRVRLRPAGWHAFNIARIEAGTPLYNIDFGEANLPHETGVLHDRVSFKKGCYLGQEIVARMQSLGHPKQKLVALRFERELEPDLAQPVSGAEVFPAAGQHGPCGHVTSSTISPMLGSIPICFAMVKFAQASPGTNLHVVAGDERLSATVQPDLKFYPR